MNLIQQRLSLQFDHIRQLEERSGIAQSHDDELLIAVSTVARRAETTFDDALASLTAELEKLAVSRETDRKGAEHD